MPKRRRVATSAHQSKRHAGSHSFGAASADDSPNRQLTSENNPSSSAFSVRFIKPSSPSSLSNICIRVFAENALRLFDEDNKESSVEWIRNLPDQVTMRLFTALKTTYPKLLSHAVITTYFMRGKTLQLSEELPINKETLGAISRVMGRNLRTLELRGFDKFSDSAFASMVTRLPLLETLNLSNCTKVGPLTVEAAGQSCPKLRHLNLNFTGVTAACLGPLLTGNACLETLKLAGVQNLSDSTVLKLLSNISHLGKEQDSHPLSRLTSLKLRHNTMSDASIHPILIHTPRLERLDLSFTLLQHIQFQQPILTLQKLSLTSTFISTSDLVNLVSCLPSLKVLNIGALGVRPGATTSIMNSTAMTLTDDALRQLTDVLLDCPHIETINLVQNAKLGSTKRQDNALAYFVRHVGRKCRVLNLSGIPSFRSEDLSGLLPDTGQESSRLTTLILNKTGIDDDVSTWVSSCPDLETLEVAETRISAEGLLPIIDSCQRLSKLNLTGCRSIKVADRRRFFEAWQEGK